MSHPVFEYIPNTSMAEACSEMISTKPGIQFKFATMPEVMIEYNETEFPPVPSSIIAITAAYLEDQGNRGYSVNRQFVANQLDSITPNEVADLYKSTVGHFQRVSSVLNAISAVSDEFNSEANDILGLQKWYGNQVIKTGGRLITAHVIARTKTDEKLIDALATPKVVYDNLPLIARESVVSLNTKINEVLDKDFFDNERSEQIKSSIQRFLQNDSIIYSLGFVAASTFLPEADDFASKISSVALQ